MKIIAGFLLCMAISLLAYSLPAFSAPSDTAAIAAADAAEDLGKVRKPLVLAPDRRNPEVEALLAEVRRLRVQAEMCQARADRKADKDM